MILKKSGLTKTIKKINTVINNMIDDTELLNLRNTALYEVPSESMLRLKRAVASLKKDKVFFENDSVFKNIKHYSLKYLTEVTEKDLKDIFKVFLESERYNLRKYQKDIMQYVDYITVELRKLFNNKPSKFEKADNGYIMFLDDLTIFLTYASFSNNMPAGYLPDKKIIFLYYLLDNVPLAFNNYTLDFHLIQDSLMHELTHYVDSKNNKTDFITNYNTEEYYNNEREYVAYRNKLLKVLQRKLEEELNNNFLQINIIEKQNFVQNLLNDLLQNCKNDPTLAEFIPFISALTINNLKRLYEDITNYFVTQYMESYYRTFFNPQITLLNEVTNKKITKKIRK